MTQEITQMSLFQETPIREVIRSLQIDTTPILLFDEFVLGKTNFPVYIHDYEEA